MNRELKYSVWISLALQGCSRSVWKRISSDGSPADFYFSFADGNTHGLEQRDTDSLRAVSLGQAEEIISYCEKKGYRLVDFYSESYPEVLRNIDRPPLLLYCMGDVSVMSSEYSISVVGTRHPTAYGMNFTRAVCSELAASGFTIISGFALGIDSAAHYTALKCGAPTIAVLGCGLEYSYPRENDRFKSAIAHNGLVLSEYMPSSRPDNWKFPQRNRILSGLGRAALVVEAGARSGSLVTAKIAAEQGRDVFCMPPADVFGEGYAGNIMLLRDGAFPAFDASDIIAQYMSDDEREKHVARIKKPVAKKVTVSPAARPEKPDAPDYSGLDEKQLAIVRLLEKGGRHADELSAELGRPLAELFLLLTELEIAGIIDAQAGKHYMLSAGQ